MPELKFADRAAGLANPQFFLVSVLEFLFMQHLLK